MKRVELTRCGLTIAKGDQIEKEEDLKGITDKFGVLYREMNGDYFWIGMIWIEDIKTIEFWSDGTIWTINEFRCPSRAIMITED